MAAPFAKAVLRARQYPAGAELIRSTLAVLLQLVSCETSLPARFILTHHHQL